MQNLTSITTVKQRGTVASLSHWLSNIALTADAVKWQDSRGWGERPSIFHYGEEQRKSIRDGQKDRRERNEHTVFQTGLTSI